MRQRLFASKILFAAIALASCSVQHRVGRTARELLNSNSLATAHVGISIYDPQSGRYWYNHQGSKYFVPASNTKIPTCYAAMKYLGDSLEGLAYTIVDGYLLLIQPTGDPTFLHPDYPRQPAWDFLAAMKGSVDEVAIFDSSWREQHWGSGWSWNDYDQYYMAERSVMPVFGNVVEVKLSAPSGPAPFRTQSRLFDKMLNARLSPATRQALPNVTVSRALDSNIFYVNPSRSAFSNATVPFVTRGFETGRPVSYSIAREIIADSLSYRFGLVRSGGSGRIEYVSPGGNVRLVNAGAWKTIRSQPADSVLQLMMHPSDNFIAEQLLLMVSRQRLGHMRVSDIVDSLLKSDFRDLPQAPRWADGSGLSRYNLFTPQSLVAILDKIRMEQGMERVKLVFPTGNEGTLRNYYVADSGYIYAKTGTLSGVVALSGYLYTKKGKLLIFSTLVNNHRASASEVRRAVERFLQQVREAN